LTYRSSFPQGGTTVQKACLAATFQANQARCPSASRIGTALVHTPILPVPLEGRPVYFVSYGSAKFPDAVLLLKGYGLTIELRGETFINGKTGQTSATFRSLPDVPFESIDVSVPEGPFSDNEYEALIAGVEVLVSTRNRRCAARAQQRRARGAVYDGSVGRRRLAG